MKNDSVQLKNYCKEKEKHSGSKEVTLDAEKEIIILNIPMTNLYNRFQNQKLSRHMAFDGRTDHHDGMKIKVHMPRYVF